ncbi:hypothetical protein [Edaphocola aurantiacus]|uniref:hypothetical protein n=1 Tax=Edaphocola aurantiacus TaxID=2601682 RepID=UPI001C93ED04|nr:hypothetical protein [Edaphocola aurantiacus]
MIQKAGIYLLLFCLTAIGLFAQTPEYNTLRLYRGKVYYNNWPQKHKDLLKITKNNPVAYNAVARAGTNNVASVVFGAIGGGLIGLQIGNVITGQPVNKYLLGAGLAAVAITIPLEIAHKKHLRRAVSSYNQGSTTARSKQLELGLCENGLGLRLKF